jgi:hypothetical protein
MQSAFDAVNAAADTILARLGAEYHFKLEGPVYRKHTAHEIVSGLIKQYVLDLTGSDSGHLKEVEIAVGCLGEKVQPSAMTRDEKLARLESIFQSGLKRGEREQVSGKSVFSEELRSLALGVAGEIKKQYELPDMNFRAMGGKATNDYLNRDALFTSLITEHEDGARRREAIEARITQLLKQRYLTRFNLEMEDGLCQQKVEQEFKSSLNILFGALELEKKQNKETRIKWDPDKAKENKHLVDQYMRRADASIDAQYEAVLGRGRP